MEHELTMKPTLSKETEKRFDSEFEDIHDIVSWMDTMCYDSFIDGEFVPCTCRNRVKQFIAEVEAAAEERGRLKGAGEEREQTIKIIEKFLPTEDNFYGKGMVEAMQETIIKVILEALNSERNV